MGKTYTFYTENHPYLIIYVTIYRHLQQTFDVDIVVFYVRGPISWMPMASSRNSMILQCHMFVMTSNLSVDEIFFKFEKKLLNHPMNTLHYTTD